jgi:hypothetical protein
MNVQNKIIALMNKRIARMRKESCHPLMAFVVAALEAGILEGGLAEPLHMSQKDCAGTVMRSTIEHGVINYADENDDRDFQFSLHIVVTDELGNGLLELDIETKKVTATGPSTLRYPGTHREA